MIRESLTVHGLLKKWAMEIPDKTALIDGESSLTFAQWHRASEHLAARLQNAGVEKGTLVGVQAERNCGLPVAFTAVSKVGARFMGLNPGWLSEDREMVFTRWLKRFILCWEGMDSQGWKASTLLPFSRNDIISPALSTAGNPQVDIFEDFYMNVTSGTTGLPKVAVSTHRELMVNTAAVCETLGLTGDDVLMSLFGVIGHPHEIFMRGLYLGATTVLEPSVFPREHLGMIREHRVTFLMGLPPQLDSLSRLVRREDADISSLRIVEAGGMKVTDGFLASFHGRTGIRVTPVWGSTETSGVVLVGEPGVEGFTRVASGYSVQLRSDDGVVEGDGRGELWVAGEGIVNRYLGERSDASEILVEGWYRTGDIFTRKRGRLYFTGRRGGLIKASGLKVYPSEVELAILKHPAVRDVCVVGEDIPGRGEAPVAYVVLRGGEELSASDLRSFLAGVLEDFKMPRKYRFVLGLPRTVSGKLDRSRIGKEDIEPDYRSELLRLDVDLVKLLNARAELMDMIDAGFNPNWVEEQINNAMGHNPGPLSDSTVREVVRNIMNTLGKG
ncbi:MAG TPA: AMP-binding protein [Candidatus Sabulitectum sp.]|nr:AMP-binding protein [Candidatus Sabulitectum sp.]HPJ28741.1 AMP-binding protein [Candidatus Sabulitectum sp.]HPR22406.1 AMP-binding protein [Candidatus Sabulitectum sp.]